MQLVGDVAPLWDALTTVTSIVAIYWQARKFYESWILWLSVDVVYFVLYGSEDLWLTALTQVAFGTMCVMGLRDWRRSMARGEVAA
jgi:nicotinamide mononucleotide transporter